MNQEQLESSVEAAVTEGVRLRSEFYGALSEPDEQALGAPATDADLSALAALLGKPLPPSYAAFLKRFGAWKMFDPATDLLPARAIIDQANSDALNRWRTIAIDTEGLQADHWLLIGSSAASASKYFIDPTRVDADGEMPVVEHDRVVAEEYSSFLQCLLETNRQYKDGIEDIRSSDGLDFSNI
jgi:hypothetical protein